MIVCHMVVGAGEADRYLHQVMERARLWADWIHVALDSNVREEELQVMDEFADSYQVMTSTWEDHEGKFRDEAWKSMEEVVRPKNTDHIFLLDADEIVHDFEMVSVAVREFPNQRIGFTFHEMWSQNQYRIDGHWRPYEAWILIPYRPKGYFRDRKLACGREPTYTATVPVSRPVGKILHYGYATEEDRQAKYDRYMRLDGGRYHSPQHLKSILMPPSLEEWKWGGLIDV